MHGIIGRFAVAAGVALCMAAWGAWAMSETPRPAVDPAFKAALAEADIVAMGRLAQTGHGQALVDGPTPYRLDDARWLKGDASAPLDFAYGGFAGSLRQHVGGDILIAFARTPRGLSVMTVAGSPLAFPLAGDRLEGTLRVAGAVLTPGDIARLIDGD